MAAGALARRARRWPGGNECVDVDTLAGRCHEMHMGDGRRPSSACNAPKSDPLLALCRAPFWLDNPAHIASRVEDGCVGCRSYHIWERQTDALKGGEVVGCVGRGRSKQQGGGGRGEGVGRRGCSLFCTLPLVT